MKENKIKTVCSKVMTIWSLTVLSVKSFVCSHVFWKAPPSPQHTHLDHHCVTLSKFMSKKIPRRVRESELFSSWKSLVQNFVPGIKFNFTEWQVGIRLFWHLKLRCSVRLLYWLSYDTVFLISLGNQLSEIVGNFLKREKPFTQILGNPGELVKACCDWGPNFVHVQGCALRSDFT